MKDIWKIMFEIAGGIDFGAGVYCGGGCGLLLMD